MRDLSIPLPPSQETLIRSAIADGTLTPEEIGRILQYRWSTFQLDVAQSSNASGESLLVITQRGELDSRRAVAENPATPGYVLRVLLQDPNPEVAALARNAAAARLCDPQALRSITKYLGSNVEFPRLMAANPCTPRDVLMIMSDNSNPEISDLGRAALAKRPLVDQTPPDLQ